jgi:hypothetical protein
MDQITEVAVYSNPLPIPLISQSVKIITPL